MGTRASSGSAWRLAPAAGTGLVFFPAFTLDGAPDPLLVHSAETVEQGEKWVAQIWVRQRPLHSAEKVGSGGADAEQETRLSVRHIAARETHRLREAVLWPGQPDMCDLPDDTSPNALHLGAFESVGEGGTLVGILSLVLPAEGSGGTARFRKLAVEPRAQGRGIGSELVRRAIAEARSRGCSALRCDSRAKQTPFYEKIGMASVGQPFEKYAGAGRYVTMECGLRASARASRTDRSAEG